MEPNEIDLANRGLACENLWCLYWQKGFCVLDRVTLEDIMLLIGKGESA